MIRASALAFLAASLLCCGPKYSKLKVDDIKSISVSVAHKRQRLCAYQPVALRALVTYRNGKQMQSRAPGERQRKRLRTSEFQWSSSHGTIDPEAIEAMTKKLEQMMGAGQRSIPVRVQIQFIGNWQGMLKSNKYKQYPDHRKGSNGGTIIERESFSTNIHLVTSPSFELKGTYTRGEKGNDQLQASYQESRTLPSTENKPGFDSGYREFHNLPPQDLKCPGRKVTSNASFSLIRKRVK